MLGIKTKIINNLQKHLETINFDKAISKAEKIALIFLVKDELKKEADILDVQQPISKSLSTDQEKKVGIK